MEYRICWSANSNISFRGHTDWRDWDDDDGDPRAVLTETQGQLNMPQGLEDMLEAAGIEWWVEVREEPCRAA